MLLCSSALWFIVIEEIFKLQCVQALSAKKTARPFMCPLEHTLLG